MATTVTRTRKGRRGLAKSAPPQGVAHSASPEGSIAKGHTAMAFGTPIAAYPWPESEKLNAALREVILKVEAKHGGIKRSNVGGWHSQTDLLNWDHDCVRSLRERIRKMSVDMTAAVVTGAESKRRLSFAVDAWANVSRDGDYNNVHDHPMAIWSGVYYVAAGEADPDIAMNGKLELLDPRPAINMLRLESSIFEGRYLIDPLPGLMVFFPSWLKHFVHPFRGKGERISISFNIIMKDAERPVPKTSQAS